MRNHQQGLEFHYGNILSVPFLIIKGARSCHGLLEERIPELQLIENVYVIMCEIHICKPNMLT